MSMKVLCTGAAGFIGQHLVRYLLDHTDSTVVALDNLQRGRWNDLANTDRLQLVEGDVSDLGVLWRSMEGMDTVFHLAAQSSVPSAEREPEYAFDTNATGTDNVLTAADEAGVRCVVFTSSREVYGEPKTLPVREDASLVAKNTYGASKIAAEAYCRALDSPGMQVAILRLTNVYGPGDRDRVIPTFIERSRQGLPLILYGGEQVVDFVPVDLVVKALWRATKVVLPGPVNIGSGQGTRLFDLARAILDLSPIDAGIQMEPAHPMEVVRFVAGVERMQWLLGIEPPPDVLNVLPMLVRGYDAVAV